MAGRLNGEGAPVSTAWVGGARKAPLPGRESSMRAAALRALLRLATTARADAPDGGITSEERAPATARRDDVFRLPGDATEIHHVASGTRVLRYLDIRGTDVRDVRDVRDSVECVVADRAVGGRRVVCSPHECGLIDE